MKILFTFIEMDQFLEFSIYENLASCKISEELDIYNACSDAAKGFRLLLRKKGNMLDIDDH